MVADPGGSPPAAIAPDERQVRYYRAAVACIDAAGLDATSVEDVARAAGSSRATLYRVFPGGRQQLVTETVTWEVARFFARIEAAVAEEPDLAAKLSTALVAGHRSLDEHALLQRLLRTEPEAVLSELSVATSLVLGAIVDYLAALLEENRGGVVRSDCDVPDAAEHLARLYLSYLGSPGIWDFDDPDAVARLVESQFLAGVRARAAGSGSA